MRRLLFPKALVAKGSRHPIDIDLCVIVVLALEIEVLRLESCLLLVALRQRLLLQVEPLEVILIAWLELAGGYHVNEHAVAVVLLEALAHKALHDVGPVAQVKHKRGRLSLAPLYVSYQKHHVSTHSCLLLKYSLEERFPRFDELPLHSGSC